jgi:hypothetical protein
MNCADLALAGCQFTAEWLTFFGILNRPGDATARLRGGTRLALTGAGGSQNDKQSNKPRGGHSLLLLIFSLWPLRFLHRHPQAGQRLPLMQRNRRWTRRKKRRLQRLPGHWLTAGTAMKNTKKVTFLIDSMAGDDLDLGTALVKAISETPSVRVIYNIRIEDTTEEELGGGQ